MEDINKRRLAKLALELLSATTGNNLKSPQGQVLKFDMSKFAGAIDQVWKVTIGVEPSKVGACGTSCCFLGYAPLVFPELKNSEDWCEVTDWVLGEYNKGFVFLFGDHWPSTPNQAVVRALYLLDFLIVNDDTEVYENILPKSMRNKLFKPYLALSQEELASRLTRHAQ
jgi:hypothetical protein